MIAKTRHAAKLPDPSPGPARGVLKQRLPAGEFDHQRVLPSAELAPWVAHYWHVGWNLEGHPAQQQETLPHPNVHLVVEGGQARLWGVHRGRFIKTLAGRGWAFGVKFKPAAFQPFWQRPVSDLADRSVAATEVFGPQADALAAFDEWPGMETMCQRAEALLMTRMPSTLDGTVAALAELVARIEREPGIVSVDQLHAQTGWSVRQLQRLFRQYVGISPKWVIARYRLHEAVALLQGGTLPDAQLALRLGYFDQAHFIRDFRRIVGQPPSAYAKAQASTPGPPSLAHRRVDPPG
ncbi:helix-turn-helix transcriptional regulator [Piscinibacter terrae]|uniref:AraC family transcriptional regulator n=1 Tax=Piscinibacter terrae TaxID=2496871 RepID=A0A3N7HIL6_9BURK|nr:helix-turn-helix transcriptional regulator [Albitalea terrae]RQP21880.1 AraC family transcriptional regulator [Albitalea terrae]